VGSSWTRRRFLSTAGVAGAGVAAGLAIDGATSPGHDGDAARPSATVAFHGAHQAGIATPTSEHLRFAAFDLVTESLSDLRGLMQEWSHAADRLTRGGTVGAVETGESPPADTGESVGLGPSNLTVTFGLGPSVFGAPGRDRFRLHRLRPEPLVRLPAFTGEALDPDICGGDLGLQICADDPQVAFHALHTLTRVASPVAVARWTLAGFGRTSNSRRQPTPRNLMGFKDGTNNVMVEDAAAMNRFVWAGPPESPPWMHGGSYMVVRRIRMMLGAWDATSLTEQEKTFGRKKLSGAPLGGSKEHDPPNLTADAEGVPVIPANAHIRLASPAVNGGQRMLRRGYSFEDGLDKADGSIAGGLLFICYQRDPRVQFIPIQRRLADSDALNRHIEHVGSAIFACPPGAGRKGSVGEALFV
jgi:deferrochelatase/peroxidase EfeB